MNKDGRDVQRTSNVHNAYRKGYVAYCVSTWANVKSIIQLKIIEHDICHKAKLTTA